MKIDRPVFTICFVAELGLIVGGFVTPPMGVIDGSVLTAVGLLLLTYTVYKLPTMINGREVKMEGGGMTLHLGDNDNHPIYEQPKN